jgi:hypothetical protein
MVKGPEGNYVHGYDRFIPEFTYKTGRTEQARLLTAALNVFYALRLQRDEAARTVRTKVVHNSYGEVKEVPDNSTEELCPRCGGKWGADPTCENCTDADGNPRQR